MATLSDLIRRHADHPEAWKPWNDRLSALYAAMDAAYTAAADRYGFHCDGCADNCCMTRFYHHTLAEILAVRDGIRRLDDACRRSVTETAGEVADRMAALLPSDPPPRIMCPLNDEGRCRIYAQRPMICRLHGIPSEMRPPGRAPMKSPGCDRFHRECGSGVYLTFDRTPHYAAMARLEQELRAAEGFTDKIKLTITDMVRVQRP